MRAWLPTLVPLALLLSPARAIGILDSIAGTIDNSAEAASLQSVAEALSGSYILKNAQTGQALTFIPDGNNIFPADGAGTAINVLTYGGGTNWIRLQFPEKDKCLSSQWGGSYNAAGVAYACGVDAGGAVTRPDNTLEPTKQWWLAVPVGDHDSGSAASSNSVLLAAQAESVATRTKAQQNGIIAHFDRQRRSLSHALSLERRFELVQRAKKSRPHWKSAERTGLSYDELKAKQAAAAKKAGSSGKKAVSKVKAKSASKKKTSSSAAGKKKAASSSASSPSSKKAASAKKKASALTSSSKVADKGLQLNVLSSSSSSSKDSSNKYFIIPVDHLIDMRTMALTGQSIASFNAQSTALDLFNPDDEAQQWIFTPA